jgi:predicted transposase/invertase (TIGR01784 family)
MDGESNKEHPSLKRSIADVIVEDQQGEKYIVEIEREYTTNFLYKACFNTWRLIVDSINSGNDYTTIKKVFHISLLYFSGGNMSEPMYHGKTIFRGIDSKHPLDLHMMDRAFKSHYASQIYPEYIVISVPLFNDVVKKELDEWLYVLKYSEVRDDFKSPYMKKVGERLNELNMSPEESAAYNKYIRESLRERDRFLGAEAKGANRGRAEGKEEGRAEGIKEGKTEEKLAIAKNMLSKGYPIDAVIELTGLAKEEIEKLSKSSG